jgi:hypothetical protein
MTRTERGVAERDAMSVVLEEA